MPDPDHAAAVLAALDTGPASVVALEATTGIRRGRLEALLKVMGPGIGAVGCAVPDAAGRPTCAPGGRLGLTDHSRRAALVAQRHNEANVMRSYAAGTGCLMEFLQLALDDPTAGPCGHCSVCTGTLPAPGRSRPPPAWPPPRSWLLRRP